MAWTTLRRPTTNRNAVLGEDVTNGMAVTTRLDAGELKAYKATTNGGDCVGFATVVTTDPNINLFPQDLATFKATKDAFAGAETLKAGTRVLVEEGIGTAETTMVVAGTYKDRDPLTVDGSTSKLRKAASTERVVAEARETKIVAAGDKLYIEFKANVAFPLP